MILRLQQIELLYSIFGSQEFKPPRSKWWKVWEVNYKVKIEQNKDTYTLYLRTFNNLQGLPLKGHVYNYITEISVDICNKTGEYAIYPNPLIHMIGVKCRIGWYNLEPILIDEADQKVSQN